MSSLGPNQVLQPPLEEEAPVPDGLATFAVIAGSLLRKTAGVSVTVPIASDFETAAASSPEARRLDQLQHRRGSGPSLAAIQSGEAVEVGLGAECPWPDLSAAGGADGVLGVHSSPLIWAGETLGALTVYARHTALRDEERTSVAVLCAHGAALLAASHALARSRAKTEHLMIALESRELIGEAKGIIMAEQRCTPDEAFDVLRRRSQTANRKLRDVARDLVFDQAGVQPPPPAFSG